MGRPHHLHDDRLVDCYMAQRRGERADPPSAEHLADCEPCALRYAELARVLDVVRSDGEAEADAIFTPERLRAQQEQIARRMETVGRPARVLSFPDRMMQRTIRVSTLRSPRLTAAAAAAGLFLGIALGASFEWESRLRLVPGLTARNPMTARSVRLPAVPSRGAGEGAADEAFMTELDLALDRPRTRELAAFDAFTPHFREIAEQR
jgi:hypothetical protein